MLLYQDKRKIIMKTIKLFLKKRDKKENIKILK